MEVTSLGQCCFFSWYFFVLIINRGILIMGKRAWSCQTIFLWETFYDLLEVPFCEVQSPFLVWKGACVLPDPLTFSAGQIMDLVEIWKSLVHSCAKNCHCEGRHVNNMRLILSFKKRSSCNCFTSV